jgi:adenylate kinase
MSDKKPLTIIAFGRSGCGKGTQLKLLSQKINDIKGTKPESFTTGDFFRNLFIKDNYTAKIAEDLTNNGQLQPLFLTVSMWGQAFIEKLNQNIDIIIDGFPRRIEEAMILADAFSFYNRQNIIILDFIVTRESSKSRMLKRGRPDDTNENAITRLDWYDNDVVMGLEYLKDLPGYIYIPVDGERTIEDIHIDVMDKLKSYI